ncbi:TfoX/Sxy family DNA transformation protein [Vibrio sp.]|uniref:TfoX/Sxy family DNA transformation protein n=1 Tax=Vibrio sp. TaxID=678 RepID=UPI003D0BEEBA
MDKPVLKDSMRLFEPLGRIKSRSMFGGFGIFANDTMFALVVNNQLHIRANDKLAAKFKQQGYQPYVYTKKGFPVVTKYYALPETSWSDPQFILSEAQSALTIAQLERDNQEQSKPERLKDLPNLRLATERMLKKAGINSVEQLHQQGALAAYQAIQRSHSSEVSLELLWALEGAIERKHWSVIPLSRREELIKRLS